MNRGDEDEMTCDGLVGAVDLAGSRVQIGGKWFPACGIVCPDNDDRPEPAYERLLGALGTGRPGSGSYVVVPCENGVLAAVSDSPYSRDRTINLHSPWANLDRFNDETYWLPRPVGVKGRRIIEACWGAWAQWTDVDAEWAAEQLVRVGSYEFVPTPTERRCELVPLVEIINLTLLLEEVRREARTQP